MTITAMKQALEHLGWVMSHGPAVQMAKDVLQQAIEQAEKQAPRQWVGLTEAERVDIIDIEIPKPNDEHWALAQSIEAALKEKNT